MDRKSSLSQRLDTEVEILTPPDAEVVSDDGVPSGDWSVLCRVWASIEPTAGGEIVVSDQSVGLQHYRVEIRWPDFRPTTSHRLRVLHGKYAGSLLDIEAAAMAGPRLDQTCELACVEGRQP